MVSFTHRVAEVIDLDMPRKVLDVGTGRGNFMLKLMKTFHNESQFTGIDLKEVSLAFARESITNDNVIFMAMNAEDLAFEDDTFDVVCISNSLHHLPDRKLVLQEVKRVLKPDGKLIISEMFCDHLSKKQHSHMWLHHFCAEIDQQLGIYHEMTYKKSKLINIVEENGFEIVSQFESSTHEEQLQTESREDETALLKNTYDAISQLIDKLENDSIKEKFRLRLDYKMVELYQIGYFEATNLIIIAL